MSPVCELAGIGKTFKRRPVIDRLDLTVQEAEMIAITGRSGTGKSTLLNIIGLLERPTEGTLRLFGQAAPRLGSSAAAKLLRYRLAYLFQNFALIDSETVDYNLVVAQTYVKGGGKAKASARAAVLERVGLAGFGSRRVYELSGGEQQRVAVARILLKPCDLVLADEPTGSLDVDNGQAVLSLLHHVNQAGKAIVIVTHDERVARACTRVVELPAIGVGLSISTARGAVPRGAAVPDGLDQGRPGAEY
jgi:putative ABC transport system ATP-binding protein